ncbi:MAG: hypothetical protein K0B37_08120 [Bacteroidales bacterium]|nr:hypothetical protein [Bacteroidales bacterium]
MKKFTLMVTMLVLTGMAGFTQSFEKGSHAINLGLGFGNTDYFGSKYYGFFPSVSGSYEYGIVTVPMGSKFTGIVSVGGYLGWSASNYKENWEGYYYQYNTFIIAIRGNYHLIFHDKFDPYAGIWFGGRIHSGHWKGDGSHPGDWKPSKSTPAAGAYLGARWFFTKKFAAYAELGYLISVFNVGITFKF